MLYSDILVNVLFPHLQTYGEVKACSLINRTWRLATKTYLFEKAKPLYKDASLYKLLPPALKHQDFILHIVKENSSILVHCSDLLDSDFLIKCREKNDDCARYIGHFGQFYGGIKWFIQFHGDLLLVKHHLYIPDDTDDYLIADLLNRTKLNWYIVKSPDRVIMVRDDIYGYQCFYPPPEVYRSKSFIEWQNRHVKIELHRCLRLSD